MIDLPALSSAVMRITSHLADRATIDDGGERAVVPIIHLAAPEFGLPVFSFVAVRKFNLAFGRDLNPFDWVDLVAEADGLGIPLQGMANGRAGVSHFIQRDCPPVPGPFMLLAVLDAVIGYCTGRELRFDALHDDVLFNRSIPPAGLVPGDMTLAVAP